MPLRVRLLNPPTTIPEYTCLDCESNSRFQTARMLTQKFAQKCSEVDVFF